MTACTRESGTCAYCRQGCTQKPGWFMPGEAEHAADLLGMTLPEFFARHLAVDWWEPDSEFPEPVFVLSPAVRGEDAGAEFPGDPRGTCVFYVSERCQVHAAKPAECVDRWCGDPRPGTMHHDTAVAWNTAEGQAQIRELLGREPETADYYGGLSSLLGGLFS